MTSERVQAMTRRSALSGMMLASVGAAGAAAQQPVNLPVQQAATIINTQLVPLAPNIYAYLQREAPDQSNLSISNCGLIVGPDSTLAIDSTGAPLHARKFLAAAKTLGKPIDRVVITHEHVDHIAGLPQFPPHIDIIAQENTRTQLLKPTAAPQPAYWNSAWAEPGERLQIVLPNLTFRDRMTLHYGDIEVDLIFPGPAHTSGDALVLVPQHKIMFMGDVAFFGVTPLNGSGYFADWMKVCDRILADPGVVTIVPGHGPVGGKAELADMRGYLELLWTEGRKRYDAGMSPGQAAADIKLGRYSSWTDADRIANNMARLYSEFKGTITPDTDRAAIVEALAAYNAAKSR